MNYCSYQHDDPHPIRSNSENETRSFNCCCNYNECFCDHFNDDFCSHDLIIKTVLIIILLIIIYTYIDFSKVNFDYIEWVVNN